MNIKSNEACKITKNTYGKYVYSKLEYTLSLLFYTGLKETVHRLQELQLSLTSQSKSL